LDSNGGVDPSTPHHFGEANACWSGEYFTTTSVLICAIESWKTSIGWPVSRNATMGEPTRFPIQYTDPEYQKVHSNLFTHTLTRPLVDILPPGVTQEDFTDAINKFKDALGAEYVFTGKSLVEYIDPYELQEETSHRKVPSGAVW